MVNVHYAKEKISKILSDSTLEAESQGHFFKNQGEKGLIFQKIRQKTF